MKSRTDFVTNSSSSSFIIRKNCLTGKQIQAIENHAVLGKKLGLNNSNYPWDIVETSDTLHGTTYMDNFSMSEFLELIGVRDCDIGWDGDFPAERSGVNWEELLVED